MRKINSAWRVSAMLSALLLSACASNLKPQPVTQEVRLTPLPASVTEIDSRSSEPWLAKASSWLQKVEAFSTSGPPK